MPSVERYRHKKGDRLFLPQLIENLTSGRARIIGHGRNTVDLIHILDVADFVGQVLSRIETIGQTYNQANPENPSWKDFMAVVANALEVPAPNRHIPYPIAFTLAAAMEALSKLTGKPPRLTRYAVRNVGRRYNYVTDRMTRELGFRPRNNLYDGIRNCIRVLDS